MKKLTRILSIDGGGIRGIIPGQVLVALENKLKQKSGNNKVRISDFFDLIAGTSTGGILTCIMLCPDSNDPSRARFSAEEAVGLYLDKGSEIFDISVWQKLKSAGGLAEEKYSEKALEKSLDNYLKDLKLSDLIKPCLITSYDIKRRKAKFFTQHDAVKNEMSDYYLKEVARATSAAPTFFEVAHVKSMTDVYYPLVDGGMFANNPALCAYAEVRKKFENRPSAKEMMILSLGTGYMRKEYDYEDAKDWGAIKWLKPLIDIMMSGVSETVDYQLMQIFDAVNRPDQYLRINSELIYAEPDMDNASEENLKNLKQDGTNIAENFDKQLEKFAVKLVENG